MKRLATTLLLAVGIITTLAPQSHAQDADTKKTEEPLVGVWRDFMNLPKKQREEFGQKLLKIQNMFNQKRIFDTLEALDELDKIFKDHPAALNVRGACYVEIRAFDKANQIFEKVLAISPKNTNVQFNLAEVDFVTKRWDSAYDRFSKLLPLLPKKNKQMIRLCEFKLLLCMLKTDRLKDAVLLRDKYDEWDDSPYYYYSRAAILYHQGDEEGAEKMLGNARRVWRNDGALAPWQDTMIEFGYIRSFYGGDDEEQE